MRLALMTKENKAILVSFHLYQVGHGDATRQYQVRIFPQQAAPIRLNLYVNYCIKGAISTQISLLNHHLCEKRKIWSMGV